MPDEFGELEHELQERFDFMCLSGGDVRPEQVEGYDQRHALFMHKELGVAEPVRLGESGRWSFMARLEILTHCRPMN